jgi:hypothetical protein
MRDPTAAMQNKDCCHLLTVVVTQWYHRVGTTVNKQHQQQITTTSTINQLNKFRSDDFVVTGLQQWCLTSYPGTVAACLTTAAMQNNNCCCLLTVVVTQWYHRVGTTVNKQHQPQITTTTTIN